MSKTSQPQSILTLDDPIEAHRFVAIDVETTGFVSAEECHRMLEIALVTIEKGQITDQWTSLLWPDRLVPYDVTMIHGLSLKELAHAPRFSEVWPEIQKRLENSTWIFHNAGFDLHFLVYEMTRLGVALQRPIIDTLDLARKFINGRSHSLPNLAQNLCLPVTPTHRSLADTLATAHLFLKLVEIIREKSPLVSLKDLQTAQGRRAAWPKIELTLPEEPFASYLKHKAPVRLTLHGGEALRQWEGYLEGFAVGTQSAFYTVRMADGSRCVASRQEIDKIETLPNSNGTENYPLRFRQLELF